MNIMTRTPVNPMLVAERTNGFSNVRNVKRPLTEEEMMKFAPSLFAPSKHEKRSDKFTYIPSIDIVRGLKKEGWEAYSVSQGGSRDPAKRSYTKHMVRMRKPDQEVKALGDTLGELILRNAHDGTASYMLNCGWFRLACLNGMMVADKNHPEFSIKFPHRGDIIDAVVSSSYKVIDQMSVAQDQIMAMKGCKLRLDEQRRFAEMALEARYGEDNPIKVALTADSVLKANRTDDVGNDLWTTFQRVQENLVKGGLTYYVQGENNQTVRNTTRSLTGVNADARLNLSLWSMAADLLHQKAA